MKLRIRVYLALILAKLSLKILRLKGYGGSTFPGYIIERFGPDVVKHLLELLPKNIIVVCGTNGKTTTTKIISDVLRARGYSVFTNAAGSNFTRGVVAEMVAKMGWRPRKLTHDYAVLELDEAYGLDFVGFVQPSYVVALNVFRDQLDRFGEIDRTSRLLGSIMERATDGCVVNGNEPALVEASRQLQVPVSYYGVDDKLRWLFPTDDELLKIQPNVAEREHLPVACELVDIVEQTATYRIGGKMHKSKLTLRGVYNFENAAAVLALFGLLLPEAGPGDILAEVACVRPAFGRGEIVHIGGRQVELVLVKNPAGFQQALVSYPEPADIMIAINDNYADGRDVSWLWDVDFGLLHEKSVIAAGARAYDMALRLAYENLPCRVTENLSNALGMLLERGTDDMRIFCNYTAMLQLRALLSRRVRLERII